MRKYRKRKKSRKDLNLRKKSERRIQYIINRLGRERGKLAEKKVFQVLRNWLVQGLILSYGHYPKWRYDDYIRHVDGWFITSDGKMVDFQIKSSQGAAQKHLKEYPNVPVIVVSPGIDIEELDRRMREIFKDKLPEHVL